MVVEGRVGLRQRRRSCGGGDVLVVEEGDGLWLWGEGDEMSGDGDDGGG